MRLDRYLVENNYCKSRQKAKNLIEQGRVYIDKEKVLKPSFEILQDFEKTIFINQENIFVSRAGQKLLGYLEGSSIVCEGKNILDVGSSTGGFTEVLLSRGAKKVTCVDVGKNQFDEELKQDIRVELFEECDIRDFSVKKTFDLVVCDVSFISLSKILDSLLRLGDEFILLFKPQFEVGKNIKRNKKGVITDTLAIQMRLQEFSDELKAKNLKIYDTKKSILRGKEGNEEFFFYVKKF